MKKFYQFQKGPRFFFFFSFFFLFLIFETPCSPRTGVTNVVGQNSARNNKLVLLTLTSDYI